MNLFKARSRHRPLPNHFREPSGYVIITGATAGLGFYTALSLAEAGYDIVLASRDTEKMRQVKEVLLEQFPTRDIRTVQLDLADFDSIDQAVQTLSTVQNIAAIVCNAGVVGSRKLRYTKQQLELQIGTNHIGHFRLLSKLLPTIPRQASLLRIVHLGSISYRWVRLSKKSLIPSRYWNPKNYAVSKLSVMTFGYELARQLEYSTAAIESVLVHPGFAWDHFDTQRWNFMNTTPLPLWLRTVLAPFAWGKRQGAQAAVLAVRINGAVNGSFIGPDGFFFRSRGNMSFNRIKRKVTNPKIGKRLWAQSEDLAGEKFTVFSAPLMP